MVDPWVFRHVELDFDIQFTKKIFFLCIFFWGGSWAELIFFTRDHECVHCKNGRGGFPIATHCLSPGGGNINIRLTGFLVRGVRFRLNSRPYHKVPKKRAVPFLEKKWADTKSWQILCFFSAHKKIGGTPQNKCFWNKLIKSFRFRCLLKNNVRGVLLFLPTFEKWARQILPTFSILRLFKTIFHLKPLKTIFPLSPFGLFSFLSSPLVQFSPFSHIF